MPDAQEDESLGTEQLPQTELDAIPGTGEQPISDADAEQDLQNEHTQTQLPEAPPRQEPSSS
jgi:hypothetical protein